MPLTIHRSKQKVGDSNDLTFIGLVKLAKNSLSQAGFELASLRESKLDQTKLLSQLALSVSNGEVQT